MLAHDFDGETESLYLTQWWPRMLNVQLGGR